MLREDPYPSFLIMNPPYTSWETLAAAVVRGERATALAFSKAVGSWLRSLVRGWIWQPDDADEFALEVLQEVIASLDSFRADQASVKTWARRIAWRMYADLCSKRRRADSHTTHEENHKLKFHVTERLNKAVCVAMAEEVAALPEDDRVLLQLFFEDGLSDSEVAEKLNIKADAARQKKRRLIQKLADKIKTRQNL